MRSFVENGKLVMLSEFVNISFLTISFFQAFNTRKFGKLPPTRKSPSMSWCFQVVADL